MEWIITKKINEDIWTRNKNDKKYFVWQVQALWIWEGDKTIEIWFTPRYIHVYSIYNNWFNCMSEAHVTHLNWITTVSTHYREYWFDHMHTLESWDALIVSAVHLWRDIDRARIYSIVVNNTSVTFEVEFESVTPPWITIHIFAIW